MLGTRRTFLKQGSVAALSAAASMGVKFGTTVAASSSAEGSESNREKKCILLFLHGGPSQLETFDPKPHAPANIRGPFHSIATAVPGLHFSETLPCLASIADRFAVVRSLSWDGPAVHEAAIELLNCGTTGSLSPAPTLNATLNAWQELNSPRQRVPASVVVGDYLRDVTGRSRRFAGNEQAGLEINPPLVDDLRVPPRSFRSEFVRRAESSSSSFRIGCRMARQLIQGPTRFVTVNMFPQLQGTYSWDCHADGADLPTTLKDYRDLICPQFDRACASLIQELDQSGELDETLIAAVGEFGRTPQINVRGGRDHWTGAWSALLAGGGVKGGAVIGRTDSHGAHVVDSPVSPVDLFDVMRWHLGVPAQNPVSAQGQPTAAPAGTGPLRYLFS